MASSGLNKIWGYAYVRPATPNISTASLGLAPGATVAVYYAGTTTPAPIFADVNGLTPLSNPFLADLNAYWSFYVASERIDVQLSGAGILTPYTLGDVYPQFVVPYVFNVQAYGALGNGISNDTAAIQAAQRAAEASGGGKVYFPAGTYLVSPTATGGTIITLNSANIHWVGDGIGVSVIRVANGSLPYTTIVGPLNGSLSFLSNFEAEHLTFDHNIANNPLISQASIAANAEVTILIFAGTDIRLHDLQVINASSVNNFSVNGVAVANVTITHCTFLNLGDDPNHIFHDASVIYVASSLGGCVIADNQFVSAGQNTGGSVTAIETHTSRCSVHDNTILNFEVGMNITGVAAVETDDITVSGNTITGGLLGIVLYSVPDGAHSTGFGLNGVTVTGNVIDLASVASWPTFGVSEGGIILATNTTELDVNALLIADNVIRYPLETLTNIAHNSTSLGIGWYSFQGKTIWNSAIRNNAVINFPLAGLRVSCGLQHVEISGNLLVNCGSTLNAAYGNTLAYRIPLFLGPGSASIIGVTIKDNTFADALAGSVRPAYFMYLAQSPTSSNVEILDNSFHSTGSAMAQQITLDSSAGTLSPFLRGAISNFVTTNAGKWALGSTIVDPATGLFYTIRSDQITWQAGLLASNVTPVGAVRYASHGTPLVAGDFVLTGWGSGASIGVAGTDQGFVILITCGTGPTFASVATLTFHDGAWPFLPVGLVNFTGGTGAAAPISGPSCSPTVLSWAYLGTPTAGLTYQFQCVLMGKPN
jgi:hypothetical protein